MEKVLLIYDKISEKELTRGKLTPNSQSVRLTNYLTQVIKQASPGSEVMMAIAAPKPGKKISAKEYRDHAPEIHKLVDSFAPTLIVACGKPTLYAVDRYLPTDFPKSGKFQRLWGRYFPIHNGSGLVGRILISPGIGLVFAGKKEDGGYLYLRTIQEFITDAISGRTDRISTVSEYISSRESLVSLKRLWTDRSGLLQRLSSDVTIAVDTETTGLNIITDKVRTVQISVTDGKSYVFPFNLLRAGEWTELFNELRAAGYKLVLQNGKYDSKILRSNGVELGNFYELSVAHVLIDEREGTHNLDFIGGHILGSGKTSITKSALTDGPIDDTFIEYAGRDTDITRRAFNIILPAVKDKPIYETLTKIQNYLAVGEHKGIRLDTEKLYALSERAAAAIRNYKGMFQDLGLNPRSSQQVAKLLGMDSTGKKLLEEVDSDLARAIIDYRGLQKVKGSYLDRLIASAEIDGRFHPDIRLAGPVTGRTASGSGSAPKDMKWLPINSQNIPRPPLGQDYKYLSEELRAQLRSLFIADDGYVMVALDLAAAEMRMAANACLDPVMISDLNRKVDTHSLLTVLAYGLDKKHGFELDIDKDPKGWIQYVRPAYEFERQSTKNATFAVLYGGGLDAIAAQALCDTDTAALLRRTIYSRYTGLEDWINGVHDQIRRTGKITTRYGRQRIFPYSAGVFDNTTLKSMLREGQNYVIQADASDYCLMGTVKFMDNVPAKWGDVWLQNLVHDAEYAAVPEDYADEAKALMVEMMETADDLPAKLYADGKYGKDWGSL